MHLQGRDVKPNYTKMSEKVYGHKRHTIGANRVRIPSEYRTFVGDEVYVAPGTDGCFLLVPVSNEDVVLGKYNDSDPLMSEYKEIARYISRKMLKVAIDSQSRMTLSPEIKKLCRGMDSALELEFCGRGNYIEVWPAHVFDRKYGDELDGEELDDLIADLTARLNKG